MSRKAGAYRPPLVDARLLLLAMALSAPAAYRALEGLIPFDDAVNRFLLITAGCFVLSAVLRTVWPFVVGTDEPLPAAGSSPTAPTATGPGGLSGPAGPMATAPASADPLADLALPPALGTSFDLLEDDIDPTLLLGPGPSATAGDYPRPA